MEKKDISQKSSIIDIIPPDIVLYIFKHYLQYEDAINFSHALTHTAHKDLVTELYLGPKLYDLSLLDINLNKTLLVEGWNPDCKNNDVIAKLWRKYEPYKSKSFLI